MKIEAYEFGTITIDGTAYRRDLKIVGGKVKPDWWRKEGHNLLIVDIEDILEARPDVLVVGQGDPGLMEVSGEVKTRLRRLGIELIARPTRQASEAFNALPSGKSRAFAAHLTC